MRVYVKVTPRASRNAIEKLESGDFKVWVTLPPVKGQANKAVIDMLARYLKVKKSDIELISGFSSKRKVFEVDN